MVTLQQIMADGWDGWELCRQTAIIMFELKQHGQSESRQLAPADMLHLLRPLHWIYLSVFILYSI